MARKITTVLSTFRSQTTAIWNQSERQRPTTSRALWPQSGRPLTRVHCAAPKQRSRSALSADRLTTSVFERLEGQVWALTELGRRVLQSQGFVFDLEEVERTRNFFKTHLSDASL
jgi:hypothetical protein